MVNLTGLMDKQHEGSRKTNPTYQAVAIYEIMEVEKIIGGMHVPAKGQCSKDNPECTCGFYTDEDGDECHDEDPDCPVRGQGGGQGGSTGDESEGDETSSEDDDEVALQARSLGIVSAPENPSSMLRAMVLIKAIECHTSKPPSPTTQQSLQKTPREHQASHAGDAEHDESRCFDESHQPVGR
jgi:hypothetical protein